MGGVSMALGRGNYEASRGQGGSSYGDFKGRLHVKRKWFPHRTLSNGERRKKVITQKRWIFMLQ